MQEVESQVGPRKSTMTWCPSHDHQQSELASAARDAGLPHRLVGDRLVQVTSSRDAGRAAGHLSTPIRRNPGGLVAGYIWVSPRASAIVGLREELGLRPHTKYWVHGVLLGKLSREQLSDLLEAGLGRTFPHLLIDGVPVWRRVADGEPLDHLRQTVWETYMQKWIPKDGGSSSIHTVRGGLPTLGKRR